MADQNARGLFRSFFLKTVLYTEAISYGLFIPISVIIYLSTVTISEEQMAAFIITVGLIAVIYMVINFLWFRFLFAPFRDYLSRYARGEAIDDALKVRVRERFASFSVLSTLCIVLRWTTGFLVVSVSVSLISGIRFEQLLNLWIIGAVVITLSLIHYDFVGKLLVRRFPVRRPSGASRVFSRTGP